MSHKKMILILLIFPILPIISYGLYLNDTNVIELNYQNFPLVTRGSEIWFVQFYADWCTHCHTFAAEYKKAAKALNGIIKFAAINGETYSEISDKYEVTGYPTVKMFVSDKDMPEDYLGVRSSTAIVEAAVNAIKAKVWTNLSPVSSWMTNQNGGVVELSDSNFNYLVLNSPSLWMVEFYAPWCSHCQKLEPEWIKASKQLQGRCSFGVVDAVANKETAARYSIQQYPVIKLFVNGIAKEDYNGKRTSTEIIEWTLTKIQQNADLIFTPIVQITGEKSFDAACFNKSLCLIAFLPHIFDCQAQCRNNYLKLLQSVAEKFTKMQIGWVWSEAGAQKDLERLLNVTDGSGYPTLAVISIKKMKYSILRGSFSKDTITDFIKTLATGKNFSNIMDLKKPTFYNTGKWNGKDRLPDEL